MGNNSEITVHGLDKLTQEAKLLIPRGCMCSGHQDGTKTGSLNRANAAREAKANEDRLCIGGTRSVSPWKTDDERRSLIPFVY